MYKFSTSRKGYLSEKQVGHGAILLAIIDVAVTLVFAHVGEAYHVSVFDWRLLLAATLVCFGLFKYGQYIVHHSNRLVMKIKQPRPEKYGTNDFRIMLGRAITRCENWYEMKKMKYEYKVEEDTRTLFSKTKQAIIDWKNNYQLNYSRKYREKSSEKPLLSSLLGLSA